MLKTADDMSASSDSLSNFDLLQRIANMSNNISSSKNVIDISLNGRNYPAWAKAMRLFLGARKKIDWLLPGKIVVPAMSDSAYSDWFSQHCLILGWLINSMDVDIQDIFTFYDTVDGLWSGISEMYATTKNSIRIFELHRELSQVSQGSMTVIAYFGYLKKRWEELSAYTSLSSIEGMTSQIALAIQKRDDTHRIHQFLMGLQPEYDALCTQILNTTPSPTLGVTYAMIEKHERRISVSAKISVVSKTPSSADEMAFMANISRPSLAVNSQNSTRSGKPVSVCDHCHKPGHLIGRCYTLQRELKKNVNSKPSSSSSPVNVNTDVASLTRQLNQVLKLLGEKPAAPSTAATATSSTPPGYPDEADFWQGT